MHKIILAAVWTLLLYSLHFQAVAQPTVPTDNLVAHYPFHGNADDASGNGHHGTVYGATLTTDRFGNPQGAYHFNSLEQDFIRVPNHPDLQITTNLTISVWIKHAATAGYFEDIVMKGNETYGFQFNNSTDEVLFHLKQSGYSWRNLNSNHTPVEDEWFNVVGTYDGTVQRVYINGVQTNFAYWTGFIHSTDDPLDFGLCVAGDNTWYHGDLDDFRVYNRVLSADEVMLLYNETNDYIGAPLNVQITQSGSEVQLSWQPVSGATSYRVYSSESPDEGFGVDGTGVFDGTLWVAPLTEPKRFYQVRAVAD